ncbi:hypothetical protein AGLY_016821 [Aphis glycines]|uniref:DUF4371 domain-containing protein n=1 Tax=Aphis glycines TaxID=307491 RepID=A0A6G0SWK9_APHGL|nr:hypothetical protein AGLY_016821 [Aphis glycines]
MFSIFNKLKKKINLPVENPNQSSSDLNKHADEEYEEDNPNCINVDSAEEESSPTKLIVLTCIESSDVKTLELDLGILESGPNQPILKLGDNDSKLMSHEKSKCHLKCMANWSGYLRISFRGHDETKESLNQGNFKEACQLMAKHDMQFKIKLESKFNFTSPDIQNELINICSEVLKTNIISQIKSVGFFAIMVDDARCHKLEYMSICVRYVKNLEVYERFLGFMDVSEKQDAQKLVNTIFQFLEQSNLENIPIFAQFYDGASVMSGKRNGVQSKLQERYECAIYTHCMAHRINLVVVDMCKNVEYANNFFNSLEALYVYFSRPSTNKKLKDMQLKMDIKASTITQISDTRWVCRYKNCKTVKDNFKVILEVLSEEIDANSNLDVAQAIGI